MNREVALKVLPDSFAGDADRLARFAREAQTLAALNHPNIAHIHGLEESGGVRALVMELVEGEDLAARVARGAVPFDEALAIAQQITEALEAAHEAGIVHRDLKPANIKVRADGVVKVLDFGLAKAMAPAGTLSESPSMAPTITTPAMTQAGMILGTAAYMSPEQARSKTVDRRADIWAFGCVLYEMLTGQRAFGGEDVTVTLARVVEREPDFDALPPSVPTRVRQALRVCLRKDPKQRASDIRDVRLALEGGFETAAPQAGATVPVTRSGGWRRLLALAGAAALIAGVAGPAVWIATRPDPPSVVRLAITTSGSTALARQGTDGVIAITPDGSRIVYRGNNQLLVRALDQLEPDVLTGLGAPQGVFISPDGLWIGFFDGLGALKKVAITGGPPVTITALDGGAPHGGTWGPDGSIIFATQVVATGLQRVSAAGGEPTVLTTPDRALGESDHVWPEFLPGGEAVLFTINSVAGAENAQLAVLDLRTGTARVLIRGGSHAHYVPTGHLIYGVAGTLRAVAFDLARLEVVGMAVPVLDGVVTTVRRAIEVAVAANGSLVYVRGASAGGAQQSIVSVDREGRATPLPGLPLDSYRDVRVSPDGAGLALATQTDVWTDDVGRATFSRLTTNPAPDTRPLWTPDGLRVVFTSSRSGYPELFWRPARAATSGSSRGPEILSICAPTVGRRMGRNDVGADGRFIVIRNSEADVDGGTAQGLVLVMNWTEELKRLVPTD